MFLNDPMVFDFAIWGWVIFESHFSHFLEEEFPIWMRVSQKSNYTWHWNEVDVLYLICAVPDGEVHVDFCPSWSVQCNSLYGSSNMPDISSMVTKQWLLFKHSRSLTSMCVWTKSVYASHDGIGCQVPNDLHLNTLHSNALLKHLLAAFS